MSNTNVFLFFLKIKLQTLPESSFMSLRLSFLSNFRLPSNALIFSSFSNQNLLGFALKSNDSVTEIPIEEWKQRIVIENVGKFQSLNYCLIRFSELISFFNMKWLFVLTTFKLPDLITQSHAIHRINNVTSLMNLKLEALFSLFAFTTKISYRQWLVIFPTTNISTELRFYF